MTWRSPFTPPPQPITLPVTESPYKWDEGFRIVQRTSTFIRAVNGRLVVDMLKGKQEVPK